MVGLVPVIHFSKDWVPRGVTVAERKRVVRAKLERVAVLEKYIMVVRVGIIDLFVVDGQKDFDGRFERDENQTNVGLVNLIEIGWSGCSLPL